MQTLTQASMIAFLERTYVLRTLISYTPINQPWVGFSLFVSTNIDWRIGNRIIMKHAFLIMFIHMSTSFFLCV